MQHWYFDSQIFSTLDSFLVTGINGLSVLGFRTFVHDLFYGGALVVAVMVSQLVSGRKERTL